MAIKQEEIHKLLREGFPDADIEITSCNSKNLFGVLQKEEELRLIQYQKIRKNDQYYFE